MTDPFPFDAAHVVVFHDACLESGKWPDEEAPAHPPGELWPWIEEHHGCNARLLRERDPARRKEDPDIAASPGEIERLERQRADALARIDAFLLADAARGEAHAETPGAMIDALSRLALRLKDLAADIARGDAPPTTVRAWREQLSQLEAERLLVAQRLQARLAEPRGNDRRAAPRG